MISRVNTSDSSDQMQNLLTILGYLSYSRLIELNPQHV
jgi:hypothetical protein